jgi:hypothetical protein
MSPPATLLIWFQLRSPGLAEDFERLMTEDRDIVRGSLDAVSDWRLTRPADVPGQSIGQADYVLIAEIVEVERFEQQASEHVQRLADDLGASRLKPRDARRASRPLKSAVGGGDQTRPRSEHVRARDRRRSLSLRGTRDTTGDSAPASAIVRVTMAPARRHDCWSSSEGAVSRASNRPPETAGFE